MKSDNTQQSRSAYELERLNTISQQTGARRAPRGRASPSRPAAPGSPQPRGRHRAPAAARSQEEGAARDTTGQTAAPPAGSSVPGPFGSSPSGGGRNSRRKRAPAAPGRSVPHGRPHRGSGPPSARDRHGPFASPPLPETPASPQPPPAPPPLTFRRLHTPLLSSLPPPLFLPPSSAAERRKAARCRADDCRNTTLPPPPRRAGGGGFYTARCGAPRRRGGAGLRSGGSGVTGVTSRRGCLPTRPGQKYGVSLRSRDLFLGSRASSGGEGSYRVRAFSRGAVFRRK